MAINIIAICPAAYLTDVNAVLEAMGRGPGNIEKKATTSPNPAWNDAATHYYMSDQGVTEAFQADLLAATSGDLPPVPEGTVWGEDGVISAADAMAAMAHLAVASFNELFTPQQQVSAALASHDPVLYAIPDPEF